MAIINLQVLTGPCVISDKHRHNKSNQVLPQASSEYQRCRVKVRKGSELLSISEATLRQKKNISVICAKKQRQKFQSMTKCVRVNRAWKRNKLTTNTASGKLHLALEIKTFQLLQSRARLFFFCDRAMYSVLLTLSFIIQPVLRDKRWHSLYLCEHVRSKTFKNSFVIPRHLILSI